ncbi:MAG: hypothetical protein EBT62_08100, partial [Opitutaceae bacterium]|nr:hypothetical protein [Opitutaceae bacterium]
MQQTLNDAVKKLRFLAIAIALNISPLSAQWEQCNGTAGLNMQSLLTKGTSNFAGGATGVYVSTDLAASYRSSNSGNDSVGPTRGFADGGSFIFTCTSQGVFRSADNGVTWLQKSSGLTDLRTSGIIYAEGNVIVATPSGVFRSDNQGDTWQTAGLDQKDIRSVAAINGVIIAGTNGEGIYRSVDLGKTWVAANNGLNSLNFRAIETKGTTLFAAGGLGSGVFRSTDQGLSWSLLQNGLPSSSYRGFASSTQLIVAGAFGAGVFYSTDNGDTWTGINQGLPDLTVFDLELNEAYIVAATNTRGVFRFALSNLNLLPAPSITTQPLSQTVTAGTSVTFTAAASGNPTPTYQWQKGGVTIAGATSATYTIASTGTGDAGSYTVVATNNSGAVTSSAATLTVNPAPPVLPTTQMVITGKPVALGIVTSTTGTIKWQVSTDSGSTYTDLADNATYRGTTTAVLEILQATNALNNNRYRYQV